MSMKKTMCEFVHGMKCDEVCKFLGEIVRCRDCKHFMPNCSTFDVLGNAIATGNICDWTELWTEPDGYCHWAERSEA